MSTNYVPESDNSSSGDNSSRRGPRRGGRSNGGGGGRRSSGGSRNSGSRSNGGGSSESRSRKPEPEPQSIVEKIASFLGFGSKEPKSIPASRPPRSAEELAATGSGGRRSPERDRGERGGRGERSDRGDRGGRSDENDNGGDRAPRERSSRSRGTGMRSPEIVEVTTPRLYIGNLSFDATESDLTELFKGAGIVQNVEIVTNRQTERPKGFAFVQMETVDEAKRAVTELHDKEFLGRKLVVSGAKASERRDEKVREVVTEEAPQQVADSNEPIESNDLTESNESPESTRGSNA